MRKKRALIILSALFFVIAVIFACTKKQPSVPSYFSVLETNWGVELPVNALWSELYEKDTGPSFHGDGIRYHVYSYQNADAVAHMLPWSQNEGTTLSWEQINGGEMRYHTYSEDCGLWLAELDVPEEVYPVFEESQYWYDLHEDNSQIIIVWNSDLEQLYIVENFI